MSGRRLLALVLVLAALAVASCARDDSGSDHDRYGGFYGGVSGGAAMP